MPMAKASAVDNFEMQFCSSLEIAAFQIRFRMNQHQQRQQQRRRRRRRRPSIPVQTLCPV